MNDYLANLTDQALSNSYFRQVLETGENMQVVIMSLLPGEEIGTEIHKENEQVLYCIGGKGEVIVNGTNHSFQKGDLILVRKGMQHNFINSSEEDMKIITIYSPPHHKNGIVHKTKADAENEFN